MRMEACCLYTLSTPRRHACAQVVGSAIAISLLTYNAVPLWAGVLITAVASFLLLLLEQAGVRFLEAVFAVLIGTMAAAFGVMYVLAGVPTAEVAKGGGRGWF
jgi:natural resistance-associated macrophage protein